jgi:signal transduction histidine kinase
VVQRAVDRWVFGDRDDPDRALAGLSRRIGDADSDPLTVVAEAVRSSLKVAAVTIVWVDDRGDEIVGARAVGGVPAGAERRRPILFEGRHVGDLVVHGAEGAPAANEAEERLLVELAAAAGAVVQAVRSADDLARSRGLIVRAREEERRRLRHDLHDGLGPTLASVAMGLDAAANRLSGDRELSDLLHDLDRALRDAIADIRRLVAGLRPPALDDVGLVPALREQARELAVRSRRPDGTGVAIEVVAQPGVPTLGAAVEVAAYRIAIEGMTNVLRHADASECRVRLSAGTDSVEVSVEDDGRGIAASSSAGIGLESMRNRAEELGGRLQIVARPGGGTVLTAVLPLRGAESGLVHA